MAGRTAQTPFRDGDPATTIPSAPRAPYFDERLEAWILTRYADVQAAFQEPNLCPAGPSGEGQLEPEDRARQARTRIETMSALSAAKLAQWESEFAPLAQQIAASLPVSTPVDVIAEFARPWCLALAVSVTGADPSEAARLAALAANVSVSTADPDNGDLKPLAATSGTELDQALQNAAQPMPGPAFVALSQTVPCLLARAWLELLNHPAELERLHANPDLLPRLVEELLRIAGPARVLHRQAIADVQLGDLQIKRGQLVHLMLEDANFDPAQFADPQRLDVSRRASAHFSLGAGQHSCAAAALIRMAISVATKAFAANFKAATSPAPVIWHGGSGFRWPASVFAQRRTAAPPGDRR